MILFLLALLFASNPAESFRTNIPLVSYMSNFPEDFFWGTATASHQIEGNNTNNDWWEAEQKGLLPHKSGRACDSYNRYAEDFDLAKSMHNNAHRMSLEWSRIEPEEGKFDQEEIEHYRRVLEALRARGLEPFVTLHHFTNPVWFTARGGWTNKKAPEYFARYVKKMAEDLGDLVSYWITINEPMIVLNGGYIYGDWPPFRKKDFPGFFASLRNMAKAHKEVYSVLHEKGTNLPSSVQVGIAKSVNYFEPAGVGLARSINYVRFLISRHIKNEWFLDQIKNHQDFVGLNYYNHNKVSLLRGKFQDGKERSDFGWEIYPEGIYHVTKETYKRYKKPIYITENGISDADDDQRPDFIKDHVKWLYKAVEEGTDVRGYFYWSLLDNFEWAEGFRQRFGLVEVNFETLERKMRPSGELYGKICRNNGLSS